MALLFRSMADGPLHELADTFEASAAYHEEGKA
jgi:hypothetical protein